MLLGDFLNELKKRKGEGNAFTAICRENGLSYKNLRPYLKQLGYNFNATTKEYEFTKDTPQPLEVDLLDLAPARISAAEAQQAHSAEDPQQAQAASIADPQQQHILFDRLFDIVDLLQQINKKLPEERKAAAIFDPALEDPEAAPLALQLHRISQHTKARKTINVSEEAAAWLDSFSDSKAYKIGDLVTLAVMQLQKRIDPTYKEGEKHANI